MSQRLITRFFGLLLCWLSAGVLAASQCTSTFTYPVQSHARPGSLTMSGQSSITSTSQDSNYPFLTKSILPQGSCNDGGLWYWAGFFNVWNSNCTVTGALAAPISGLSFISDPNDFATNPNDFPAYSGSQDLGCTAGISPAGATYRNGVWSDQNCVATLKTGQTYKFESLSLSGGAKLDLNGATLYVKKLTLSGYSEGLTGSSGQLHVNELTVSGDGKLAASNVTVYNAMVLASNDSRNVSTVFQPHYLASATLKAQSAVKLATGSWPIRQLTMADNSQLTMQGSGRLDLYNGTLSSQGLITTTASRSELRVNLYQNFSLNGNAYVNGYLQAHYLKQFQHTSTTANTFYFSGGAHWIDTMVLSADNARYVFDSGLPAQLYLNGDLSLSGQTALNQDGNANNLMIFGFGGLTMSGNSRLNAILYLNSDSLAMSNQAILTGAVSAVNVTMTDNSKVIHEPFAGSWPGACEEPLTCVKESFSSASLSSNWVVTRSSGDFTPVINSRGRLQLTQASPRQSTATTYQRLFPAVGNLITIGFDQYAYGGNGADGMAVVLSDAGIAPQPGAFGGPLGYGFKPDNSGFAGGWLGVGIDEYGNYAAQGGDNNKTFRPQAVSLRGSGSGESGYNYIAGTASGLNPEVDSGNNGNRPHRYRLSVDSRSAGQSMVTVERNSGAGYTRLIGPINMANLAGQAALPQDFMLSLTGSTGDDTNIHEIDNVEICALRSNPIGVQIDHFELAHSGQALTCNPETVTIKACANKNCTSLIKEPVTATLSLKSSASPSWVDGNTVSFSDGTTRVQLRNNTASPVTIGVSGSTPTTKPYSATLCQAGSGALSAAACTLAFADSGLVFNVPDTLANQPQSVTLQAVKKDNASQQCIPGFANVTKPIRFWSGYVSPNSNIANTTIQVNGQAIAASPTASPTTQPLGFNAQGEATVTVNYADAGKVQLNAGYTGTGDQAGLVMTGADEFVARPVGLCITTASTACSSDYAKCSIFKKAGETFSMKIRAVAWESATDGDICSGNIPTPNFVLDNIPLTSTLVAPTPGNNAALGKASYSHQPAADGLNTLDQSVSEVGVFKLTATPPTKGYFDYTIPAATSAPVGRFVPWDFDLPNGVITPGCGQFSYMSQPFGVKMTVQARNKQAGITKNYQEAFAKGELDLVAANNKDGVDRTARVDSVVANWAAGEAKIDTQSRFARLSERDPLLTTPEEPFKALRFGLRVQDGESLQVSFLSDTNMNPGMVGDCKPGIDCNARQLKVINGVNGPDTTMTAYYGQLLATTGVGIATAELAIPLQLQYFDKGGWQTNLNDNCTQLSLAGDGIDPADPKDQARQISLDSASGAYTLSGQLPKSFSSGLKLSGANPAVGGSAATAVAGQILLNIGAPRIAVSIPYAVVLAKQPGQPTAPIWLRGPAATADDTDNLKGIAIFYTNRGNDRIIYRREMTP